MIGISVYMFTPAIGFMTLPALYGNNKIMGVLDGAACGHDPSRMVHAPSSGGGVTAAKENTTTGPEPKNQHLVRGAFHECTIRYIVSSPT